MIGRRAYSGTRPTSPGSLGVAARSWLTVRVTAWVVFRASDEASMPLLSQTASPTAPAATRPSPDRDGSRTTRRTPEFFVSRSSASPYQLLPLDLIFSAVAASVTMKIGVLAMVWPALAPLSLSVARRPGGATVAQAASSGIHTSALSWP